MQVYLAGLILEREEGHAAGALRALAHEHDAGGTTHLPWATHPQFGCAEQPLAQPLAQQGHWMAAESQVRRKRNPPRCAAPRWVPAATAGPHRDCQRAARAGAQRQRTLGTGHFPERQVAIAAQRRERTRRSERFEIAAIERGALREILHALEPLCPARALDTLCALLRERFHQAQTRASTPVFHLRDARACIRSSLSCTSTGRTSTPCSRASRTSCAGHRNPWADC